MAERRAHRGITRTDAQIMKQMDDIELLVAIGRGVISVDTSNRMHLKRLAREDLCLAGFGLGSAAMLLPRGQRIVAVARGRAARVVR